MAKQPYEDGSANLQSFRQLCLLGEGAYSAVYKVQRLADKEVYALKRVKLPSLSDKEKQNAFNEVRLIASVHHKNIIAYKEAFFDEKTRCLCIVTECADGGDLFQQIEKCQKSKQHLQEADIWRYFGGMGHGLKALHDMRILHRDLKAANVFLHGTQDGLIAKLGDFNVSKVAKRGLCMTQTGTPYYASPEVWRDMPYDAKSDMWSLGCVLYEMCALRPPFRAEDMEGLYKKVLKGQYPRIPAEYSHELAEVIAKLLQVNPRHRLSVDQLLQMPQMRRYASNDDQSGDVYRPSDLLQTIKLPKNAIDISTCLPKPQYELPLLDEDSASGHLGRHAPQYPAADQSRPAAPPGGVARGGRDKHYDHDGGLRGLQKPGAPPDGLDAYLYPGAGRSPSKHPLDHARAGSPGTPSTVRGAQHPLYGGRRHSQQQREQRRAGGGSCAQAPSPSGLPQPAPPAKQAGGEARGIRLPRIFSRRGPTPA